MCVCVCMCVYVCVYLYNYTYEYIKFYMKICTIYVYRERLYVNIYVGICVCVSKTFVKLR